MRYLVLVTLKIASPILTARTQHSSPPTSQPTATLILKAVDINFMLRGYCFAGSAIEDTSAFGGFWAAENYPQEIFDELKSYEDTTFLWLDTSAIVSFSGGFEGYRLFLVNATDSVIEIPASDSRISIVHEAIDTAGVWQEIEYLPSSWCGNSYHYVFLGPNQQWEFVAPKYSGEFKTQIRASLRYGEVELYSISYEGGVNLEQFSVKQGHSATDLMDPYTD